MTDLRPDSSESPVDTDQPSLLTAILRRRKAVVLGMALAVAMATAAFAALQTKHYAATASVAVQAPPGQSTADAPNMATEEQTADSLAVAQRVQRQLGLRVSASTLLSALSVGVPVSSNVLTFTYSDPSARNAQIRANAFANAYLSFRQTQLQNQVRQSQATASEASLSSQISYLAAQLSGLRADASSSGGGAATAVRVSLANRVNGLTASVDQLRGQLSALDRAAGTVSAGSVIGPALLPGSPAEKVVPYAIVGFFLGLVLGFGVAAVLERLDDRLRNPGDVRAGLGAPVLGVIPRVEPTAASSQPRVVARGDGRQNR